MLIVGPGQKRGPSKINSWFTLVGHLHHQRPRHRPRQINIKVCFDETKLGANAANPTAVESLEQDLDKIGEWSVAGQMPSDADNCSHVYRRANGSTNYSLFSSQIVTTNLERDIEVCISTDFKLSRRCVDVETKANKVIFYVGR